MEESQVSIGEEENVAASVGFSVSPTLGSWSIQIVSTERHGQGIKDSFVSYQIQSTSSVDGTQQNSVRRRYRDFLELRKSLLRDHPTAIIPPLPSKQRLAYLDRFSEEFIEKRRVQLELFLIHISLHEDLCANQNFVEFLRQDRWFDTAGDDEGVIDAVGENIMNVFSKIKEPEERFIAAREENLIWEENLGVVEKRMHQLHTCLQNISNDMDTINLNYAALGALRPDQTLFYARLANRMKALGQLFFQTKQTDGRDVMSRLFLLLGYCQSKKETLHHRDQKQIEAESLADYLRQANDDKRKIQAQGYATTMSYIRDKINELRGNSLLGKKEARLHKKERKIEELSEALQESKEIQDEFSKQVENEINSFETLRLRETHTMILKLAESRKTLFEKTLETLHQMNE